MSSLSKLNNWATLLANIGVLVGIIFLISELNLANRIATNEAELKLLEFRSELSRSNQAAAEFLVKLQYTDSVLTAAEEVRLENLSDEYVSNWMAVNTLVRNGLVSDTVLEGWIRIIETTLHQYPMIAAKVTEIYGERWSEQEEGSSPVIDALRQTLEL